jgi:sarcosine oxidase gamma subunit
MTGEEAFRVICFRSVGAYMRKLLETAAEGGPVALF